MKTIQISNNNTILKLLNNNLKYEVIHDGFSWIGQGRKPFVSFNVKMFGKYLSYRLPFSCALSVKHKTTKNKNYFRILQVPGGIQNTAIKIKGNS